ncbi:hypothetical protein B4U79_18408 [Dinothrombium tinctorium]|uniref:Feline leukemia virus subgroup C receptor-related protein 2-like protein n=1 Tax=Dinothrombium tinctorium TaxID=1965070 RepID=A0A3S4QHW2_9ACAR|nr:hypothetical protein B4U79_18408 [Dinothrombium tinctorium]
MDFHKDEKSAAKIEYKTYKRRFLILLILLLLQSFTGSEMLIFSSLTNVVSNYYNVSDLAVNWLSLSGLVLSVVAFYPLTSACEKYGLRDSITTLAFLGAFGASLKLMAIQRQNFFWLLLIGQLFQSCSLQISLFTTPTVASIWFKSEHTAAIMSSSQVVLSLGLALTFLLPDLIFKKAQAIEEIRNGFNLVLIPATVISVILFLLAIFVIRDKPPTPPSAAQKFRETAENNLCTIGGLLTFYITSLWLKSELLMYFSLFSYGICNNANSAILPIAEWNCVRNFTRNERNIHNYLYTTCYNFDE